MPVEAERALRARLSAHFDPIASEPLPDRLTAMLTTNVADLVTHRAAKATRWYRPSFVQWGAMAASLALGLVVGGTVFDGRGYVSDDGQQMVASGALADALQTQLASSQGAKAEIRIGTSFANAEGEYCRTFESAALDGIACNRDGEWQLRRTMSGGGSSIYRQASAGELAEAAAAMMADDPLDAAAEKAAAERGWK
jgi:hypothetical protein